ncbi:hypothetical protein FRACYDRAFT_233761 [Fragilariopsis cylindrus CCMP1102]|uniref:Uncharacterized protein n=1 Tax=Fragilariopsis cylindrus CCMP1102 TaxID=635003 RepID=A0A1E7FZK9_9STRA|nr:hypothetical protein FRACYDRAFT_233761 [Fragilariopsis cylindrus CCMP1102]|eukprot:OEU23586.1 hypothetical protein FRACYDRAFT_233761 [Fragilariopsis cylindrus CCMP1102]
MRVIISNNGVNAFFVVHHATPLTLTSSSSSLCLRSSPSTTTTTTTTTTTAAAISNWTTTIIPTDTTSAVIVTNSSNNNINRNSNKRSFWNNLESILFPSIINEEDTKKKQEDDNPDLILAHWENVWEDDDAHYEQEELATEIEIEESARLSSSTPSSMTSSTTSSMTSSTTSSTSTSVESLTNFLEVWSRISLQNDKGLTTPVTSSNYKEQKSMEKNGSIPDRKNAKVDAWSPGGVQIEIININTSANKIKSSNIGIILRRCDIDGDTIIKRTTERAIIRRLDDAIRIWKKNN